MINGVARYGVPSLVRGLIAREGDGTGSSAARGVESLRVGGRDRLLFLDHSTGDSDVAELPLRKATATLRSALHDLPKLARAMERPRPAERAPLDAAPSVEWSLALDEIEPSGQLQRHRLPFAGPDDFTGPDVFPTRVVAAGVPLSEVLGPIELDPLTVCDDDGFLDKIATQPNVPPPIREGLGSLY
jgi:5-methylthioadenosine/S-adenosylhomocysteine deaminase